MTFQGAISGTGPLKKIGSSDVVLTSNNPYTGDMTVTGGTLQIGDGGTSGSVAGNIINNGNLVFNRSDSYTYAKNISGSGSLEKQGAGTLTLSGAASYTGATTISGGTLQFVTGGTIGSLAGNIVDNGTVIFNHSNSLNYGGVISGPGRLMKQGSGEIVLTGDNTFTGGTTVNGGTLSLGEANDDGALVSGAGVTAMTLAGGNLNLRAGSIRGGTGVDTFIGTAGNGGAGVAINAATTFDNHGTISGGAGGSVTNGPGFGGNGGAGIAFTGAGTLTNQGTITGGMGGFGTFTTGFAGVGVLATAGGTLVTLPSSVIQGGPNIAGGLTFGVQFTTMAGTLRHQGVIVGGVLMDNLPNSVTLSTGSQIVGGPLIIGNNPAATLTLDGTGTHSLSAAVPSGIGFAGSLTKQGSGTWTIDQNFPSPGSASVAEGKLLVTGSIAGSISAASGATLGGTGRIGGNASINGTLAPGINTGLLTFDSNLTLGVGSITAIEIGGASTANFDQISVDDILTYGGTLMISLLGGFEPHAGDSFQLFKDFDSQSGTFSSVAFTNPGFVGNFNHSTGMLNIVSIPEPSTSILVSAALLGMFASRRRLRM
ncbi:autotransporter-associated beta strand repeat-containing protein [Verrucomicrobiota bacterium sgz303538]